MSDTNTSGFRKCLICGAFCTNLWGCSVYAGKEEAEWSRRGWEQDQWLADGPDPNEEGVDQRSQRIGDSRPRGGGGDVR